MVVGAGVVGAALDLDGLEEGGVSVYFVVMRVWEY